MGAVSSCCSAEPSENRDTIRRGTEAAGAGGASDSSKRHKDMMEDMSDNGGREGDMPRAPASTVSGKEFEENLKAFRARLENCMVVIVLLADGTQLTCDLKLNSAAKSLIISCDTNVREISLSELKSILHGKDELRRVETKAALTDDPSCVALHMVTGNCIPVRFDTVEDKGYFLELIKRLKNAST